MEELNNLSPLEDVIDREEERRIYVELNKIDGLHEYLKAIMSRDLRLHFSCNKEQQDLVRGGYFRIEYLAKLLKKYSNIDKVK